MELDLPSDAGARRRSRQRPRSASFGGDGAVPAGHFAGAAAAAGWPSAAAASAAAHAATDASAHGAQPGGALSLSAESFPGAMPAGSPSARLFIEAKLRVGGVGGGGVSSAMGVASRASSSLAEHNPQGQSPQEQSPSQVPSHSATAPSVTDRFTDTLLRD